MLAIDIEASIQLHDVKIMIVGCEFPVVTHASLKQIVGQRDKWRDREAERVEGKNKSKIHVKKLT